MHALSVLLNVCVSVYTCLLYVSCSACNNVHEYVDRLAFSS